METTLANRRLHTHRGHVVGLSDTESPPSKYLYYRTMYADHETKSLAARWAVYQPRRHCTVVCREITDTSNVERTFHHVHLFSKTLIVTDTHIHAFALGLEYERAFDAAEYHKIIPDTRIFIVTEISFALPCTCTSERFIENLSHVYDAPYTDTTNPKAVDTARLENVLLHQNDRWILQSREMKRWVPNVITLLTKPKRKLKELERGMRGFWSTIDDDDVVPAGDASSS